MKYYAKLRRILEMVHYDTFHKENKIIFLNRFHRTLIKEIHGIFFEGVLIRQLECFFSLVYMCKYLRDNVVLFKQFLLKVA